MCDSHVHQTTEPGIVNRYCSHGTNRDSKSDFCTKHTTFSVACFTLIKHIVNENIFVQNIPHYPATHY